MSSMTVKWNAKPALAKAEQETARVLGNAVEFILARASESVPLEEGTLARSGSTDVDAKAGEASVSYDTPYAIRLHENPQYSFKHGRRGKWLELTLQEQASRLQSIYGEMKIG